MDHQPPGSTCCSGMSPPPRWAGSQLRSFNPSAQIHQLMVAEEEFKLLKSTRMARRLHAANSSSSSAGSSGSNSSRSEGPRERSACLVAMSTDPGVLAASDAKLVVEGQALVGTLDLHAVRAMDGQILIGEPAAGVDDGAGGGRRGGCRHDGCTAAAAAATGIAGPSC